MSEKKELKATRLPFADASTIGMFLKTDGTHFSGILDVQMRKRF